MKPGEFDKHVVTVPMGVPEWREVEKLILSPTFCQIYQMVTLAAEGRLLGLAGTDLSSPQGQHAATKAQGIAMGMRMALDHFISLSEEKADGTEK